MVGGGSTLSGDVSAGDADVGGHRDGSNRGLCDGGEGCCLDVHGKRISSPVPASCNTRQYSSGGILTRTQNYSACKLTVQQAQNVQCCDPGASPQMEESIPTAKKHESRVDANK